MATQKSKPKATTSKPKAATSKSKAAPPKSKASPSKSKTSPSKTVKKVSVPLNGATAIFFQTLVRKGLASFELAPKMGDNVTATLSEGKDGRPNIIVNAALVCWAPEHLGK